MIFKLNKYFKETFLGPLPNAKATQKMIQASMDAKADQMMKKGHGQQYVEYLQQEKQNQAV